MKFGTAILIGAAGIMVLLAQQPSQSSNAPGEPQFTKDNELIVPTDYREWIFLSSGLGMTYGPLSASTERNPLFDNVFVAPPAYRAFLATGKWPEKTMFVLETRSSVSKGSINNGGHYQGDRAGVQAEVKDSSRFPGNGWAFFPMGKGSPAKALPQNASCYGCHPQKGAVDNTFVQFYPTLLPVAKQKGTLTPAYLAASGEQH